MADLASKNTDSVTKAFQAGLISQRVALKELRQQSELTGMWTNITDEDIEKADDEVMNPDEGMGGDMFGNPEQQPPGTAGGPKGGDGGNDTPNPTKSRQEEREKVTDSFPFALDGYEKDPDPKNWRTINGSKVHLTKGKIDGGAGGKFTGKSWSGKEPHSSKNEQQKGKAPAQSKVQILTKKDGDTLTEKQQLSIIAAHTGLKGEKAQKMLDVLNDWTAEGGEFKQAQKLQTAGGEYGDSYYDDGAALVEEYVKKAPKYNGELFRGMVIDKQHKKKFLQNLKEGKLKIHDGTTQSWSSKSDIGKMYAEGVSDDEDLPVIIHSKNGHPDAASITHFGGGAYGLGEILVSKDGKWNVTGNKMKDGVLHIEVEPQKTAAKSSNKMSKLEELESKLKEAKANGDFKKQIFFTSAINQYKKTKK
jgi:hypothetical protein